MTLGLTSGTTTAIRSSSSSSSTSRASYFLFSSSSFLPMSTRPSPPPCVHLQTYRSSHVSTPSVRPFRSLHQCLRVRPPGGRAEIRRDSDEVPRCGTCGTCGPRLYACLTCAAVSCRIHAPHHSQLFLLPASTSSPIHHIAVDVDRAELFCCACGDQIYDADFDAAVVLAQKKASSSSSSFGAGMEVMGKKRRRVVEYRPWVPDDEEKAVVARGARVMVERMPPWGLRGLNNLGSTCFMNSVLQALLHTPPLRNYFLSDRHNQFLCRQEKGRKKCGNSVNAINGTNGIHQHNHQVGRNSSVNRRTTGQGTVTVCLACDLDTMYSAVFSGDRTPYSPVKFLYSWWRFASNLASYEQQDAHEFFISMLDGIHEKEEKDDKKHHSHGNGDCCIAHRVFSGILRSDVTCTICGFTSTTYDPCIDISLDLDSSHVPPKAASMKSNSCNGVANQLLPGLSTLNRCLEHFTRPERLGTDQKLFCQHCQVRQESLKQMSIRKLPLVTCFHIKRFEHSSSRKMSKKIDRYLQFPFSLDMEPYLSSSILRSRFGNRIFAFDGDEEDISAERISEFELFAVITHSGKLDSGHYITFLRLSNQWYRCDDAWITNVSESIVRSAQAYMLFYVQKVLSYKASESDVPS